MIDDDDEEGNDDTMIQLCYDTQSEIMIGLSSGLETVQLLMNTSMKFLSMLPRKSSKR